MFIRGPVNSYGRSGSSWGAAVPTEWDAVSWDATRDIEFNVREATALGFACFFIHRENDDPAKNLNIREL